MGSEMCIRDSAHGDRIAGVRDDGVGGSAAAAHDRVASAFDDRRDGRDSRTRARSDFAHAVDDRLVRHPDRPDPAGRDRDDCDLSLIHISEPTRPY